MAEEGFGWGSALRWVWDNLDAVLDRLGKVRDWFRTESAAGRGILVIGPGGVGKTTLAAILSGRFDWLTSNPWEYNESYGIDYAALKDDPKVGIVVPPGQPGRREALWAEVERDLAGGRYRGVIVATAYGYHSLPQQSYRTHALYRGRRDEFLAAYLEACRADEVAVLERVAAHLRASAGRVWLLSVVAKEDLWPPDGGAEAFYRGGRYAEVVAGVVAAKGRERFRHELVAASLVIANFRDGGGEVVAKNVEGYDHRRQVESVRRLFEALDSLREWEAAG